MVVVVVVVNGHSSGHLGFGTQTVKLPSLLAIVLQQPVTLQDLLALVVLALLAVLARVAVLRQRVEGQFGLAWLDVLLQQLVNGQRGFLHQRAAAVVDQCWLYKEGLSLLVHQVVEICGDTSQKPEFPVRTSLIQDGR